MTVKLVVYSRALQLLNVFKLKISKSTRMTLDFRDHMRYWKTIVMGYKAEKEV